MTCTKTDYLCGNVALIQTLASVALALDQPHEDFVKIFVLDCASDQYRL